MLRGVYRLIRSWIKCLTSKIQKPQPRFLKNCLWVCNYFRSGYKNSSPNNEKSYLTYKNSFPNQQNSSPNDDNTSWKYKNSSQK